MHFDCRKGLASCCNDRNVVTGTSAVGEKRLASSSADEVVSHTCVRRLSSTPDQKEAKVTFASLIGDTRM